MPKIPTTPDEIQARLAALDRERKRLLEAAKAARPEAAEPTTTLKRRRLTDISIRSLKTPERGRLQIPDAACPGLWLRLTDRRATTWSYVYRVAGDERTRRFTIGRWPAITCAAARKVAKELAHRVANGEDPARTKAEQRHQNGDLVEQVCAEFVARRFRVRGLRSTPEAESLIRRHILPHLAGLRIGQVTRHQLLQVVDAVSDRGQPRAANKVAAMIRQIWAWAEERGLLTQNVATAIRRPHIERARDRTLDDAELIRVWHAAEQLDWPWRQFTQTLIRLGQRRTETAAIRWTDIDLVERAWRMPAETTKMGRARVLPLPGVVVEMLEAMPRLEGSPYVFGAKISSFAKLKAQLDTISGVTGYVLHDLRRTFATNQQRIGTRLEVTEQLLGHVAGSRAGVVGVYQRHDFLAEQRVALERWCERLAQLTGGAPSQVVALRLGDQGSA